MDADTLQLLEDCEHREERLSGFERGCRRQLEEGRGLSRKQAQLLDEIWERATAHG